MFSSLEFPAGLLKTGCYAIPGGTKSDQPTPTLALAWFHSYARQVQGPLADPAFVSHPRQCLGQDWAHKLPEFVALNPVKRLVFVMSFLFVRNSLISHATD